MTRSTRTATMLGAAAALVLSLSACGGSDSEYCDLLSDESEVTEFDPTDENAMEESVQRVQDIVDAAPDDVRGDWETFASFLEDPEAAATADPAEFESAMQNISQNAQDECDIDLS